MRYFADCKTLDQGKKVYRKLLLEVHPDSGGDEKACKDLIRQFEMFLRRAVYEVVAEEQYKHTGKRYNRFENEMDDYWYTQLQAVMGLNVRVEVIGSWIWIFDSSPLDVLTLSYYDFTYSKKHEGWFWANWNKGPYNYRFKGNKNFTMGELRDLWGWEGKRDKQYLGGSNEKV